MADAYAPGCKSEWDKIASKSVDEQANVFLKAFILEFGGGKFEEVLDIAQQFKKYLKTSKDVDLEEVPAHKFLETRGEAATIVELRSKLKLIDVDCNSRMAFVEYCLYKFGKSVKEFFEELSKPHAGGEALQRAIDEYRKVLAKREEREKKIEELKAIAEQGGVKGMKAKNELAQMLNQDQLGQNRAEITAAAKKRAAEKNAVDPFAEEQKRVEAEKKKKAEEDKKKQEESRARLKNKASLWENKSEGESSPKSKPPLPPSPKSKPSPPSTSPTSAKLKAAAFEQKAAVPTPSSPKTKPPPPPSPKAKPPPPPPKVEEPAVEAPEPAPVSEPAAEEPAPPAEPVLEEHGQADLEAPAPECTVPSEEVQVDAVAAEESAPTDAPTEEATVLDNPVEDAPVEPEQQP